MGGGRGDFPRLRHMRWQENGDNGVRCKHESCKKELTRRNKERQAAAALLPAGDAAPSVDNDPTECFIIKEVLGVSMCLKMSKAEKRLGCDYGDNECYYQVRGKYGGSKDEDPDDMMSDTRGMQLKELVANMDESQLGELNAWAGQLQKVAKAARNCQLREAAPGERRVRATVSICPRRGPQSGAPMGAIQAPWDPTG